MSNARVAAATDNLHPLLVRVTFDREMTVEHAAQLERALRDIFGAKPATKAPAYKVVKAEPTGNAPGHEFQLRWTTEAGATARRVYQRRTGLLAAQERLNRLAPGATDVRLLSREVGAWAPYDGTPADAREYRVTIMRDGWSKPCVRTGTARTLRTLLERNADADLRVDQRDVLSRWVEIAGTALKAVA